MKERWLGRMLLGLMLERCKAVVEVRLRHRWGKWGGLREIKMK